MTEHKFMKVLSFFIDNKEVCLMGDPEMKLPSSLCVSPDGKNHFLVIYDPAGTMRELLEFDGELVDLPMEEYFFMVHLESGKKATFMFGGPETDDPATITFHMEAFMDMVIGMDGRNLH